MVLPLLLTNMADKLDVICEVTGGADTGQSGAIRYAISVALRSFLDERGVEKLRLGEYHNIYNLPILFLCHYFVIC